MKEIGFVGLGDMGSGMAGNLLRAGFSVHGYDPAPARLEWLEREGGHPAENAAAVGERSGAAFVMVMNGDQARDATLGPVGLAQGMQRGGTILLSATIRPGEAEGIATDLQEHGIILIDTPVSGGKHGADAGKLNLYPAGDPDAIERVRPVLEAISKQIVVTGERPGQGQVAKAALQALIGGVFAGVFEAAVFGSKAGLTGATLERVFSNSDAGSPLVANAIQRVVDREFVGTGSNIATMYKDLCIVMDLAREVGAPLFSVAQAYGLFQAGITRFAGEDNWCVTKILESLAGTSVTRSGHAGRAF
jgi:3-hydroxyisobutyrate dehydrogenase/putative dehydrogenase